MKRLLILIICLSVILCSIPVCASNVGNYSNDLTAAYGLLSKLGILDIDIERIDADKTYVTRQEFAQYIANALKISDGAYTDKKLFEDVVQGSVINDLCSAGYIKPAENFEGSRNITNEEALILAVRALGYESYAAAMGGQSTDYLKVAKKINLKATSYDMSDASYANVIELLFNMLHTKTFGITAINEKSDVYIQSDDTLLNSVYDIYYDEGIIASNSYLSIYKNVECCSDNRVILNGTIYDLAEAEELVGQYVRLYYMDNGLNTGVYVYSMDEYNESYNISSKDVKSASFESVSYYNENGSDKSVKLENPLYVYNNEPLFGYSVSEIDKLVKADRTELRVIKHGKSGVNDVVFINTYVNGIIKTIDTNNKMLYIECYGKTKMFSYGSNMGRKSIILENGVAVSENSLKNDQLVSVYESFNKNVTKFDISTKKVTGVVEYICTDSDVKYYGIEGEKYAVDKNSIFDKITAGESGTFKIDTNGLIADVEYKTEGIIGYVYKSAISGVFSKEYKFKIFDEFGQHKIYSLAEKLELDNVSTTAADAYDKLIQSDGSHRQFIIFSCNDKDEIKEIDSCLTADGLCMVGKNLERTAFKYDNGYVGYSPNPMDPTKDMYCLKNKTLKFNVPYSNGSESYDDEDLFNIDYSYCPALDDKYSVELYKINDETEFVDFVVEYDKSYSMGVELPSEGTAPCMVANIYNKYSDDQANMIIDGQNQYGTILTRQEYLCDFVNVMKVNGDVISCAKEDITQYVSEGDVVQFGQKNSNGKTGSLRILFDYSEEQAYYCFEDDGSYKYKIESMTYDQMRSTKSTRAMYGYVYNSSTDKNNAFSVSEILPDGSVGEEYETFGGSVINNRIVIFDSQKNRNARVKVSLNTPDYIIGYENSGEAKQKVFVYYTVYSTYYPFFYK